MVASIFGKLLEEYKKTHQEKETTNNIISIMQQNRPFKILDDDNSESSSDEMAVMTNQNNNNNKRRISLSKNNNNNDNKSTSSSSDKSSTITNGPQRKRPKTTNDATIVVDDDDDDDENDSTQLHSPLDHHHSQLYHFDPTLLHTIHPQQFLDASLDEIRNHRKSPWEMAWNQYVKTLKQKYEQQQQTEMEVKDINHLYSKWLPAFEEMKCLIARRVVKQVPLSLTQYTHYDIRIDERKWMLVEGLLSDVHQLLERNEQRPELDVKKMIFLARKRTEREKRERFALEESQNQWETIRSKNDEQQMEIFIMKFGPENGKKNYFEWKELQNLESTLTHMNKAYGIRGRNQTNDAKSGGGGIGGIGDDDEYGVSALDMALKESVNRLKRFDIPQSKGNSTTTTTRKTAMDSIVLLDKDDEDYDELLDEKLF